MDKIDPAILAEHTNLLNQTLANLINYYNPHNHYSPTNIDTTYQHPHLLDTYITIKYTLPPNHYHPTNFIKIQLKKINLHLLDHTTYIDNNHEQFILLHLYTPTHCIIQSHDPFFQKLCENLKPLKK